ncbi:hypothetical protein PENTCL1PPCAC_30568, partial [Pristionchus entomophagus]
AQFLLLLFVTLAVADDPNAYLAFKLNSTRMGKVMDSFRLKAESLMRNSKYNKLDASMSFIPSNRLEVRLIDFYYDAAEHRQMIPGILAKASAALCSTYPRYLAFDDYYRDDTFVKGGIQDLDNTRFEELAKALNDYGIVYEKESGISNEKAGFVAAYDFVLTDKKNSGDFLDELLEEPLHSSAFIDTIHLCVGADQYCEDSHTMASWKIKQCGSGDRFASYGRLGRDSNED